MNVTFGHGLEYSDCINQIKSNQSFLISRNTKIIHITKTQHINIFPETMFPEYYY